MVVACAALGWACAYFGPILFSNLGGEAIKSIYSPSGSSVPASKQYSQAESLAVRGMFREAIAAFEVAASEHPEDPQPYLRVARLYRDEVGEFEDAARWFKRACRDSEIPAGMESLVVRELVEMYRVKLKQPEKAAPELARFAEARAGTPEGDWAEQELREVKQAMLGARQDEGESQPEPEASEPDEA
jgi:tetratricopeptide (TPR) repeat protein